MIKAKNRFSFLIMQGGGGNELGKFSYLGLHTTYEVTYEVTCTLAYFTRYWQKTNFLTGPQITKTSNLG